MREAGTPAVLMVAAAASSYQQAGRRVDLSWAEQRNRASVRFLSSDAKRGPPNVGEACLNALRRALGVCYTEKSGAS
jgi:hypothetical protein